MSARLLEKHFYLNAFTEGWLCRRVLDCFIPSFRFRWACFRKFVHTTALDCLTFFYFDWSALSALCAFKSCARKKNIFFFKCYTLFLPTMNDNSRLYLYGASVATSETI